MLRFFPTLGEEYRAIRNSQRFRGIGVGILHTLTHLPSTIEYILIPLAADNKGGGGTIGVYDGTRRPLFR